LLGAGDPHPPSRISGNYTTPPAGGDRLAARRIATR